MLDEILTFVVLLMLLGITFYQSSLEEDCSTLLSREWSTAVKAVCCILVVLVHIPQEYSTKLQNLVGSFAFIAVTFFFLFSGYGLSVSKNKKEYLTHFWRNRLVSLLIPMYFVNFIRMCYGIVAGDNLSLLRTLLNIDGFVLMIIFCYGAFYIVYRFKLELENKTIGVCVLILLISILTYCLEDKLPFTVWPVPCLGFIYGVLIDQYKRKIDKYLRKHRIIDGKTISVLIMAIFVGGGYIKVKEIVFWGDYFLRGILALLMLMVIIMIMSKFKIENKANQILGNISYEIYLIHGLVIKFLEDTYTDAKPGSFILSSIMITVVLAYIVNWIDTKLIKKLRVR